jgi:hypothetical protein
MDRINRMPEIEREALAFGSERLQLRREHRIFQPKSPPSCKSCSSCRRIALIQPEVSNTGSLDRMDRINRMPEIEHEALSERGVRLPRA